MDTLRDDGARKVLLGLTSVEEVLAATQEDAALDVSPASLRAVGSRATVGGAEQR
jgi:general secretion pathway protein E